MVRIRVEVTGASGVLVDPGAVTFSWQVGPPGSPSAPVTYTYGVGAQITRDSVGIYRTDLNTSTVTSRIEPHQAVVTY